MNTAMRDILWIAGMPRSGTSWLAQILGSHPDTRLKLCPLFSYEFKNALDENSTLSEWTALLDAVYRTRGEYLDQEFLRKEHLVPEGLHKKEHPAVLVIKSNRFHDLLPRALELGVPMKFLFIVRDPRAAIASWLYNPLEFPSDLDPIQEWRSGRCRKTARGEFWGFDDWVAVTHLHLRLSRQYPDRVKLIRYEDLREHPVELATAIFGWCGLPFDDQTREFIVESRSTHSDNPRSVYKNPSEVDGKRKYLPAEIHDEILQELKDSDLSVFLDRGYESAQR